MISKEKIALENLLSQDYSENLSNRKTQELQPWTPEAKFFQPIKLYCEQNLPQIRERKKKSRKGTNTMSLQNENTNKTNRAISNLDQSTLSQKLQQFKCLKQTQNLSQQQFQDEIFTNRKTLRDSKDLSKQRSKTKNSNRIFFMSKQLDDQKKQIPSSFETFSLNRGTIFHQTSQTSKNKKFKPNKSFWTNRYKISQEVKKLHHTKSFIDSQDGPLLDQAIKKLDQHNKIRSKSNIPKLCKELYTRLTPQEKIANRMKNEIINKYQKIKQLSSLIGIGLPQSIIENLNNGKNVFQISDDKLNTISKFKPLFSVPKKNHKNQRMFFCDLIDTNRNSKLKTYSDLSISQINSNFFDLTSQ